MRRPKPRPYRSDLRRRLKAETRGRIVKAVVAVILHDGVHAFTMQNVADRAGLSLRTVYRHFRTREQLLEGLSDHLDATLAALGLRLPTNIQGIAALAHPLYHRYFARIPNEARASVIASVATGYRSKSHLARLESLQAIVAASYPRLTRQELEEAAAVIVALSGSRVWYVITAELGLDSDRGGRAVEWGLRVLLKDLKRRNDAARRSRRVA